MTWIGTPILSLLNRNGSKVFIEMISMQILKQCKSICMNKRIAQKEILNFSTIQRNDMFANFETMQMNLYERNNCTEIHLNHSLMLSSMSSSSVLCSHCLPTVGL